MARFKKITLADVERTNARSLRKEYTRLRHYATDRLSILAEEGFKERGYKIALKEFPSGYKLKANELRSKMVEVSQFLNNPLSLAENMERYEKAQIEKLNRHGVPVNEKNFKEFLDFMEEFRQSNLDSLFDSTQIADNWQVFKKYKITPEQLATEMNSFGGRKISVEKAIVLTAKRKQPSVTSKLMRKKWTRR